MKENKKEVLKTRLLFDCLLLGISLIILIDIVLKG